MLKESTLMKKLSVTALLLVTGITTTNIAYGMKEEEPTEKRLVRLAVELKSKKDHSTTDYLWLRQEADKNPIARYVRGLWFLKNSENDHFYQRETKEHISSALKENEKGVKAFIELIEKKENTPMFSTFIKENIPEKEEEKEGTSLPKTKFQNISIDENVSQKDRWEMYKPSSEIKFFSDNGQEETKYWALKNKYQKKEGSLYEIIFAATTSTELVGYTDSEGEWKYRLGYTDRQGNWNEPKQETHRRYSLNLSFIYPKEKEPKKEDWQNNLRSSLKKKEWETSLINSFKEGGITLSDPSEVQSTGFKLGWAPFVTFKAAGNLKTILDFCIKRGDMSEEKTEEFIKFIKEKKY
jgi:hypothetical protein